MCRSRTSSGSAVTASTGSSNTQNRSAYWPVSIRIPASFQTRLKSTARASASDVRRDRIPSAGRRTLFISARYRTGAARKPDAPSPNPRPSSRGEEGGGGPPRQGGGWLGDRAKRIGAPIGYRLARVRARQEPLQQQGALPIGCATMNETEVMGGHERSGANFSILRICASPKTRVPPRI